ncbi:restriction endonuclease subunit S [Sporolactobacillus sp. KGMB 08714]|uniref:restriction endonuclease subunit S n=1 Tax=Sporolactobacillus sp. KGMB 08714 TaxID=3064704 RepID=UPI002FBD602A
MGKDFMNYELGRITKIVNGATPSTKRKEYYDNGTIPWITPKDLSGYANKHISRGERNITQLGLKSSSAKLLPKGTVLFSSRAPIGYVAIANNNLATNQGFKSFICDKEIIDNEYLYYFLIGKRDAIETMANGSVFKELPLSTMKNIPISLPSLAIQKKIVRILGDLDKKIELNYDIMTNLEKLAERTYKHWFEEKPECNELRIRKGWYQVKIGDVVKLVGGGTPRTDNSEYWNNGEINWFTPSDITKSNGIFVDESQRKITEKGLENSTAKLIPSHSLLLSSRATIGELAINQKPAATNQGFIVLLPNNRISLYQLYFWAKRNKRRIISMANGSTFKEISKRDFKSIEIMLPVRIEKFNLIMKEYFDQIERLTNEISTLKMIRDNLIPKLIK